MMGLSSGAEAVMPMTRGIIDCGICARKPEIRLGREEAHRPQAIRLLYSLGLSSRL